jgi:hypothetical protein
MAAMEREGDHGPHRRAITSHAIRRMQRNGGPAIFENELRAIWREERLPNPLQQYDRFVLLIGQRQPSSGEFAGLFIPEVEAQIGMALRKEPATAGGFDWLLRQLQADRLIEFHSGSPKNRNPSHN